MNREPKATAALAVLVSGGLDSAILVAQVLREQAVVQPLYVRQGLYWEEVEWRHLLRFLEAIRQPGLRPLIVLDMPVADLYGEHWSLTGRDVPDADSPDEAVFLPGRNVLLLAKAMLWCHLHGIGAVAVGSLQTNPFPDATPEFFGAFQDAVNRALGGAVKVRLPFAGCKKIEVMRQGAALPLELTFSCIFPVGETHCGRCNKCAERRHAFAAAGIEDKTDYNCKH